MGNTNNGSTREIEQAAALLKAHRKHIEGISHTVRSQHAQVEQLLKDVCDIGRIIENISVERTEEIDLTKSCPSYTRKWKRNTENLLASVQSSLECQSESLLMSFKTLNKSIFETFNLHGISFESPSDVDDSPALEYDNSPQKNYKIDYKKLQEESENEIDILKKNIRQLEEDKRKTKNEMEERLNHEEEMQKRIQEYQAENVTLKAQTITLEDKISELKRNKKSMKHMIGDLKTDKETLEQRMNEQTKTLEDKISELERNKKSMEQMIGDLKTDKETLKKRTNEQTKALKDKISELERNKKFMENMIGDLKTDKETLEQRMNEQTKTLEDKISELERDKKSMEHMIEDLKTDKETLEQRVNDLREHKPVSIQLYYQLKGDMMLKILDELKSMLAHQIGVKRSGLQFIVCQRELDVNPDIPVLVFCVNTSRLGTDAGNVLHNLKVSSKVAALIFHHKDVHALPNQSSERVLTGPEFKALGGIFDIAFLSEKGIYPCDMNNAAAAGIENFLKTQS